MKSCKAGAKKKNLLRKLELRAGARLLLRSWSAACASAAIPQHSNGTAVPGFAAALCHHLCFMLKSFPCAYRVVLCVRSWKCCLCPGSSGTGQTRWSAGAVRVGFGAFPQELVVWLKNSQVLKVVFGKFTVRVKLWSFPRVQLSCASEVKLSA